MIVLIQLIEVILMAIVKLTRQNSHEETTFYSVYQVDIEKTDGSKRVLTGTTIGALLTYKDRFPESNSFTVYDEARGITKFLFDQWPVYEVDL